MTEKQYGALVARMAPKSPMWRDCLNAFWIGGLICVVGQIFMNCYGAWGLEKQDAGTAASMTLVALSALLTGLSVYDDIAKHAGAGTLVPITGFANAIAAPAVEFKTEGFVLPVIMLVCYGIFSQNPSEHSKKAASSLRGSCIVIKGFEFSSSDPNTLVRRFRSS